MNKNYRRGVRKEYKAIKQLEEVGYTCIRASGSHGIFDVVAIGPNGVRCIQIKRTMDGYCDSEVEMAKEQIKALPVITNVVYEVWVWQDNKGWIRQEVVA